MSKYYFHDSEELCHTLDYFKQEMKERGIKEMTLTEAKPDYGNGFFYCKKYETVGEVGEGCGRMCEHYNPRNGKNGRCCFSAVTYEESDKKITINARW